MRLENRWRRAAMPGVFFVFVTGISAASLESPTGNRTTPPTLNSVSPIGVARGASVEMTVEGLNLAGASKIYFSEPGVTGKILTVKELPDLPDIRLGSNGTASTVDLGPLPPRNQVVVQVTVPAAAKTGAVRFRLLTPLGTTPEGSFLVEPYYGESPDREPNNIPEEAVETYLPAILAGTISRPGDFDYYKLKVNAGERIVLLNQAPLIGSTLEPVVTILGEDQAVLKEFGADGGRDAFQSSFQFEKAGTYYIRVADFTGSGRASNFYRIILGTKYPVIDSAYPLGIEKGKTREISLTGYNLGPGKATVQGQADPRYEDALMLRPKLASGFSFNEVRLAVGDVPEVDSTGGNTDAAKAQALTLPVTVNGRISAAQGSNFFRFHARKNQKVIVDVQARRLGSPLDSFVEVLDSHGKRIERAEARAVLETNTTLSERDSASSGIRIVSWTGMNVGDYLMAGSEIVRIAVLPKGPDEDVRMEAEDGQRLTFFDTTPEAHSIDQPVYKVQIHPPGTKFSPNGLPLVHLYYQNDDGGPGYGKDSRVNFVAPEDGDYTVRISDVRGMGGNEFAYRLGVREPRPDFRLSANPDHPSIPVGGVVPISVEALRMDGFNGPIQVQAAGLPAGVHATAGVIAPGEVSTTILLSAEASAKLDDAFRLKITGSSGNLSHGANMDDPLMLASLMPPADISVATTVKEITLKPGGRAEIPVSIARQNGFRGRVPVEIRNLPARVLIPDVGLNGVLINENESEHTVVLEALPNCPPLEQLIYVAGSVETRSSIKSTEAAPQAILLKVK
ncbi:MAG TPA: hypothetical protein VHD76_17970 [Bryobacteraceae bacterium]|nr:hypothetical protein [Bryobacteraceae bacterium]